MKAKPKTFITNNIIIFPLIFFFLNTSPKLQVNNFIKNTVDSLKTIYLIKQRWHTAVVFNKVDVDSFIFPVIKFFPNANLIDIGWGDEEFYQHPDFNLELAFNALFLSTPSALRVEGIHLSLQEYFDISEVVVQLKIKDEQLNILLDYINKTIFRDEKNEPVILSKQYLDRVIFFKAMDDYHLFNTCNTWLANGLVKSGFEMEDEIILTEQLFNEAAKVGEIIKSD